MPNRTINSCLPAVEFAVGSLSFTLALCLQAVCQWAGRARFDIRYGSFHFGSISNILSLPRWGFIALYILVGAVLLFFSRRIRVKLLAAIKGGRRLELDLLAGTRHLMTAVALLALLVFSAQTAQLPSLKGISESSVSGPEILSSTQVISHALGMVDGNIYLNCLEGFEEMYSQGVRVFEVDIQFAADGSLVLVHEWDGGLQSGVNSSAVPTREEFLSAPILDRYTPLSFQDLLLLMEKHPNVCVITDTKYTDSSIVLAQFTAMLNEAEELGLTCLFDRIIIQFYSPSMLEALDRVYHFPHYIYTLYMTDFDASDRQFRETAEYCADHGVEGITMWANWWHPSFAHIAQEYGISVYTHTVNNLGDAKELLDAGVSAVYTDTLTDKILMGNS